MVGATVGGPVVGVGGTGVGVPVGASGTSTVPLPEALIVCAFAILVSLALAALASEVSRATALSGEGTPALSGPRVTDGGAATVGVAVEATGPKFLRAVVGDAVGAGSSGMLEEGSAVACSASACVADTTTVGLAT